jgi:hypothetical protein
LELCPSDAQREDAAKAQEHWQKLKKSAFFLQVRFLSLRWFVAWLLRPLCWWVSVGALRGLGMSPTVRARPPSSCTPHAVPQVPGPLLSFSLIRFHPVLCCCLFAQESKYADFDHVKKFKVEFDKCESTIDQVRIGFDGIGSFWESCACAAEFCVALPHDAILSAYLCASA